MNASGPEVGRPRIGVLSAGLGDKYATAVLSGITAGAHARGVDVVTFTGGLLETHGRHHADGNAVYELAAAGDLVGLVVLSGSLVNLVGAERLGTFAARFSDMPIVSVAVPLPGAASVLVDGDRGIRSALEHLMEIHGRHRVAFVQGPRSNDEAARRFQVYEEVFADFAIKVDRELVVEGAFTAESGAAAIETLVDHRKARFDAIVFANDVMAIAALDALESRGIRVPRDVSVIGFDDIEEASWSSPTLTTVRQPLQRQGRVAVEMLLDRVSGRPTSARAILPTQVVVRESCGCVLGRKRASSQTRPRATPIASEQGLRTPLLVAIQAVVDTSEVPALSLLLEAFLDEIFGKGGRFFGTLEGALASADLAPLQAAIGVLRRIAIPSLDVDRAGKAEDLLVRGHLEVAAAAERVQARRRIAAERVAHRLSELGQRLLAATDERRVVDAFVDVLAHLPIDRCRIAIEGTRRSPKQPLRMARQILDYGRARRDTSPIDRPTHAVITGAPSNDAGEPRTLVVQPLHVGARHHGFVVLESAPEHGYLQEELCALLSHAIERIVRENEEN